MCSLLDTKDDANPFVPPVAMAYDPVQQAAPLAPPLASKHAHTATVSLIASSQQSPTTGILEDSAELMKSVEKKTYGNPEAHWRDRLVSVDHLVSVRDVKLSSPK